MYHGITTSYSMFSSGTGEHRTLDEIEKEYIQTVLQAHHQNRSHTAKVLGIDRKTLLSKIKKYNLD